MSSEYSCSPDDRFFRALDKSLTIEYSSQKMSNFLSDLLVAKDNLDDDPQEGFISYEEENYYSDSFSFFTNPSAGSNASERNAADISVDMFDDGQPQRLFNINQREADNINVDMFDDESDCDDEVDDRNVDLSDDEPPQKRLVVNNVTFTLEKQSDDESIDMFAEFQSDIEVMETDLDCSAHLSVAVRESCFHNEEADKFNRGAKIIINEPIQRDMEAFSTHSKMVNLVDPVNKVPVEEYLQNIDENAMLLDEEYPRTVAHPNQKLLQQNIEPFRVANVGNEQSSQSSNVLMCVPSNISCCETNEDKRTDALETSQMQSQIVERARSEITSFPTAGDFAANTSMRSCNQSSLFKGFPPVALLRGRSSPQIPNGSSSRSVNDMNSTFCEEYNNHYLTNVRRSSSQSTDFRGFAPYASDLNSTRCDEYETARNFVANMNATQVNFDLEEAYSQCFSESQNRESSNPDRRQSLIDEIEKLILKINNDLVCGRKLAIEVPYTVSWNNCGIHNERLFLHPLGNGRTRSIVPVRGIAMLVYILSFIYKLLLNNETCTKREIYYSDPEFTQSQSQVDNTIMDICFILNARPWEIGVLSSSKGLIAGSIKLTLKDDTIVDVAGIDGGILLPHQTMAIKKVETTAKFVLLVEKHTIYEKLLLENVLQLFDPCILITGKGFPDINTRAMLKKIWDDCKCPIYALVDADPHGIEIMLSYRHGSKNMSFLNDDLAIPSIRWIGGVSIRIQKFSLQSLPLTKRDINLLDGIIKRPYINKKIYKELLVLKKTLKKAELEALISSGIVDCISSYLLSKIQRCGYI